MQFSDLIISIKKCFSHVCCNCPSLAIINYLLRAKKPTWHQEVINLVYNPESGPHGLRKVVGSMDKESTWPGARLDMSWLPWGVLSTLERMLHGFVERQWLWHQTRLPSNAGSAPYQLCDLGKIILISTGFNFSTVKWGKYNIFCTLVVRMKR